MRALIVMNPHSGGGKVERFALVERARQLGADVALTGPDLDAAELVRRGAEQGAQVLGVAGGDGSVSAAAAVAADVDRPLLVIPAGTRNHFARDLGLDLRDPAAAMDALHDGEPVRVDLGVVRSRVSVDSQVLVDSRVFVDSRVSVDSQVLVDSRVFVNNVSFGLYAEALLEPGYRQAKARAFASVAPRYLEGRQAVEAAVRAPQEMIDGPQVVLISNNPYHLATLRHLGRRFGLDAGLLGLVVIKRPAELPPAPPDLLTHLRAELRREPRTGSPSAGVVTWAAPTVELSGSGPVPTGIDGEPVTLELPVRCSIRPQALQVLLPRRRPGVPPEPTRGRRP